MTLRYVGHACFVLESTDGRRIILDPFRPNAFGRFAIRPFSGRVDVVVSTHGHLDHYHVDPSFGTPHVVQVSGHAAGIDFVGIEFPHGRPKGRDHGFVTGFRFIMDGISFFHPGDIGSIPTEEKLAQIGEVDVMFVPVGGTFTLGPEDAWSTVKAVAPKLAIPMHYLDPEVSLALEPVEKFLELVPLVEAIKGEIQLSIQGLTRIDGRSPKIVHLQRA